MRIRATDSAMLSRLQLLRESNVLQTFKKCERKGIKKAFLNSADLNLNPTCEASVTRL